jgi:hypothetical protein
VEERCQPDQAARSSRCFEFKWLRSLARTKKRKNYHQLLRIVNWTWSMSKNELIERRKKIDSSNQGIDIEISTQIKEWFLAKTNYLILVNASFLYLDRVLKTSL